MRKYWALLATLLLLGTTPAAAQVLKLEGAQLPDLVDEPRRPYSFFAYRDGRFEQVPHQWVNWSEEGLPWFEGDEETTLAGDPERIDETDRLLLRESTAGDELDRRVPEQVVAELRIGDEHARRYFYVVRSAFQQRRQKQVSFDRDRMRIQTTDFSLQMAEDNLLVWEDFFYRGYRNPQGQQDTILDTMKLRLSAGMLTENQRITLNNNHLDPEIKEVIEGPLATLIHASTRVRVGGVPVLRARNYFMVFPERVDIHTHFRLPGAASAILRAPSISMSLAGNELYEGRLRTSWTGRLEAEVDGSGELSRHAQRMKDEPMGRDNWLWFSTGRGFDVLGSLEFHEGFDGPVHLLYEDDAELADPPERFPGQLPNVGFSLEELPFGQDFFFVTRLYFSGDSNNQPPHRYAKRTLGGPQVRFRPMN